MNRGAGGARQGNLPKREDEERYRGAHALAEAFVEDGRQGIGKERVSIKDWTQEIETIKVSLA